MLLGLLWKCLLFTTFLGCVELFLLVRGGVDLVYIWLVACC
jgi:hypothetical protein